MKLQKILKVRHLSLSLLLVLILSLFAACGSAGTEDDIEERADSIVASESTNKKVTHSPRNESDTKEENDDLSSDTDSSSRQDSDDEPGSEKEEEQWYQTYTYFEDEDGNYYHVSCSDDEEGQTQLRVVSYGEAKVTVYLTTGAENYAETVDGGYKYYDTESNGSEMTFYPETAQLVLVENQYVTDYCTPAGEMNIADPYGFATGETWWDTTSQRCSMKIECLQDGSTGEYRYEVTIAWSSGAENSSTWEIKQGTYDESLNAIVFTDCRYYTTISYADGTTKTSNIYTNGTGSIVMDENNQLYWNDDKENAGADCVFENTYYDSGTNGSSPTEGQDNETANNVDPLEYFLNNCDKQYFSIDYFDGFSQNMCLYARNGIYAKSGRIFSDTDLRSYYSQFDWYSPTIDPDDFTENMLNEVQKANLDILVDYEVSQGYRTATTYTEPNYSWYRSNTSYIRDDYAMLFYGVQNDVMLNVQVTLGGDMYDYLFSVEPDEVGSSGELIYRSNGSILVYYTVDNHIEFTCSDHSFYSGTYYANS